MCETDTRIRSMFADQVRGKQLFTNGRPVVNNVQGRPSVLVKNTALTHVLEPIPEKPLCVSPLSYIYRLIINTHNSVLY